MSLNSVLRSSRKEDWQWIESVIPTFTESKKYVHVSTEIKFFTGPYNGQKYAISFSSPKKSLKKEWPKKLSSIVAQICGIERDILHKNMNSMRF